MAAFKTRGGEQSSVVFEAAFLGFDVTTRPVKSFQSKSTVLLTSLQQFCVITIEIDPSRFEDVGRRGVPSRGGRKRVEVREQMRDGDSGRSRSSIRGLKWTRVARGRPRSGELSTKSIQRNGDEALPPFATWIESVGRVDGVESTRWGLDVPQGGGCRKHAGSQWT